MTFCGSACNGILSNTIAQVRHFPLTGFQGVSVLMLVNFECKKVQLSEDSVKAY